MISIVKSQLYVDIMCARPGGHCIDMPCDQYLPLVRQDRLQRVRMYGLEFWAPPIAYLERVYTRDWRTPRHQWKPTYSVDEEAHIHNNSKETITGRR